MPSQNDIEMLIKARNEASATLQQVRRDLDPGLVDAANKAGSQMTGMLRGATQQALGFAAAMVGIRSAEAVFDGAKEAIVGFNGRMEQSAIAWEVMLKSADKATVMLSNLQQLAATSPFEFPELEKSARLMMAMGFSAKEIIPTLTDIGNVASAAGSMGADAMNGIARALGQMITKGKVSAEEMNQLAERGFPAWDALSAKLGKPTGELMKLAEQGKISGRVMVEAFREFSQANFGDLMERQAKTFEGALATIRDNLRIISGAAFKPLFDRISELAQRIAQFTSSAEFPKWGARVAAVVEMVLQGLGVLAGAFARSLSAIARTVLSIGLTIYEALSYLNPFARHSPSLIESVEAGIDRILARYQDLAEIEGPLREAAAAVERFRQLAQWPMLRFDEHELADQVREVVRAFGPSLGGAFQAASQQAGNLEEALIPLQIQIRDLTGEVAVLKEELDAATAAVKAKEQEIALAERAMRPLTDAVREAKDAYIPWADAIQQAERNLASAKAELETAKDGLRAFAIATADAKANLDTAKLSLAEAEQALVPFQRELNSAKTNLDQQKLALEVAKDGLRSYRQAVDDTKGDLSRLNDEMRVLKDRAKDLTDTPIEGAEKYDDALRQVTTRMKTLQVQMDLVRSRGGKPSKAMEDTLSRLQAQASALQGMRDLDIGEKQRQIQEALNPPKSAQGFGTLIEEARTLGQRMTPLQSTIDATTRTLRAQEGALQDQERALRPLERAVDAQQAIVHTLDIRYQEARASLQPLVDKVTDAQVAFDAAALAQARAETTLRPLITNVDTAAAALERLKAQAQPFADAIVIAERAVEQYRRAEIEPLTRELEGLRDTQAEVQGRYDTEKDKLSALTGRYDALATEAKGWRDALKEVAAAAADVNQAADAAAKAGGLAGGSGGGGDKTDLNVDDGLAKLKEAATEFDKTLADLQTKFAPILQGMQQVADTLDSWVLPLDIFRQRLDGLKEDQGLTGINALLAVTSMSIGDAFGPEKQVLFDQITQKIGDMMESIGTWAHDWQVFLTQWSGGWDGMVTKSDESANLINAKVAEMRGQWVEHHTEIERTATRIWTNVSTIVARDMATIQAAINDRLITIRTFWEQNHEAIEKAATTTWNAVKLLLGGVLTVIGSVIEDGWNRMHRLLLHLLPILATLVESNVTLIKDALMVVVNFINGDYVKAWESIKDLIANQFKMSEALFKQLVDFGRDIIDGMMQGLAQNAGRIKDKLVEIAKGALDAARGPEGINSNSPSKKFHDLVGVPIVDGIVEGIEDRWPVLSEMLGKRLTDLTGDAADQVSGRSGGTPYRGALTGLARLEFVPDALRATEAVGNVKDDLAAIEGKDPLHRMANSAHNINEMLNAANATLGTMDRGWVNGVWTGAGPMPSSANVQAGGALDANRQAAMAAAAANGNLAIAANGAVEGISQMGSAAGHAAQQSAKTMALLGEATVNWQPVMSEGMKHDSSVIGGGFSTAGGLRSPAADSPMMNGVPRPAGEPPSGSNVTINVPLQNLWGMSQQQSEDWVRKIVRQALSEGGIRS